VAPFRESAVTTALPRIKQLWVIVFALASTAFLIRYIAEDAGDFRVPHDVAVAPLVAAFGFQALFWFFFSDAWRWAVRCATGLGISLPDSFVQIALLFFGKYLPGKIWGVVARGAQLQQQNVSLSAVATATFHEQYVFLVAVAPVCCIAAILLVPPVAWLPLALIAVSALVLGYYGQSLVFRIGKHFLSTKSRGVTPINATASLSKREYTAVSWRYVAAWAVSGLTVIALYLAVFDRPVESQVFGILILANTIGYVVGFVAVFAPAGLGVREATASSITSFVMPLPDALALSLLSRLLTVAVEIVAGLAVFGMYRYRTRRARTTDVET
jgi:uncharacterized membrane protein YbhN (UPF0104 family)